MFNPIVINTNLVFVLACLTGLGSVAIFIYAILKKEKEFQTKQESTFHEYTDVIQGANKQAEDLLNTTAQTSAAMLNQTRATSEHIEVDLDRVLQGIAKKHIELLNADTEGFRKEYQQHLGQLQEQLQHRSEDIINQTQTSFNQTFDAFTKSMLDKTTASQSFIDQRTEQILQHVEQEITEYKDMQIQKIEEQVNTLVKKTYQDVLKRSIPETLQRELILESLERAKADTMFTL